MQVLDLTNTYHQSILLDLVCNANIGAIHLAPPRKAVSRASEQALPSSAQQYLLGRPHLQAADAAQVAATNKLYAFTLVVAAIAVTRRSIVSVINASNSHFWTVVESLADTCPELSPLWAQLEDVALQACMFGSGQGTWITLRATKGVYSSMALACNGNHGHDQGALDLVCPKELCEAMVRCLACAWQVRGTTVPSAACNPTASLPDTQGNLPKRPYRRC